MSDELKPCPFCGNNDYMTVEGTVSSNNFQVVCSWLSGGCGASGGVRRTQAEAIAAWNTRADDAPEQPVDNQADSREQLEAWAREEIAEKWACSDSDVSLLLDDLRDLLDRQAAITRAEVFEDGEYDCRTCDAKRELQDRVDSLTAERDELRERVRKLTMKIMAMEDKHKIDSERWVGIAHQHQEDLHEIMELRGKLQGIGDLNTVQSRRIEELEAERDELRKKLDEKQRVIDVQRDSFLKLEAEYAELRRMLADAAEAI
jgi:Lar family restriction alleviation protein